MVLPRWELTFEVVKKASVYWALPSQIQVDLGTTSRLVGKESKIRTSE